MSTVLHWQQQPTDSQLSGRINFTVFHANDTHNTARDVIVWRKWTDLMERGRIMREKATRILPINNFLDCVERGTLTSTPHNTLYKSKTNKIWNPFEMEYSNEYIGCLCVCFIDSDASTLDYYSVDSTWHYFKMPFSCVCFRCWCFFVNLICKITSNFIQIISYELWTESRAWKCTHVAQGSYVGVYSLWNETIFPIRNINNCHFYGAGKYTHQTKPNYRYELAIITYQEPVFIEMWK